MADAVTATVVDLQEFIRVHLTNISDGTGESAVIKLDKSAYLANDAAEPASLDIVSVRWSVGGFASVRFLFDHDTDDVAFVCGPGSGYEEFTMPDLPYTRRTSIRFKNDPRSAGGTGDILLTTNGAVSGATYDITLLCHKNPV